MRAASNPYFGLRIIFSRAFSDQLIYVLLFPRRYTSTCMILADRVAHSTGHSLLGRSASATGFGLTPLPNMQLSEDNYHSPVSGGRLASGEIHQPVLNNAIEGQDKGWESSFLLSSVRTLNRIKKFVEQLIVFKI